MEEVYESKARIGCSSRWEPIFYNVQVCRAEEDFKVARYVDSFTYEKYNEELNTEGENIWLLNGDFLTYCIIYYETKEHTNTLQERAVMIEHDYKAVLCRVKVIVDEAKAARLEASSKKKKIREGKRKAEKGAREEISRKKARQDNELEVIIPDNPEEEVIPKKGKKKTTDLSQFLEVEKVPKKSKNGPPGKSVGVMLMNIKLFKNKYNRLWIFGEGVSGFVSIFYIERGDARYNCRPISEVHLKEMRLDNSTMSSCQRIIPTSSQLFLQIEIKNPPILMKLKTICFTLSMNNRRWQPAWSM